MDLDHLKQANDKLARLLADPEPGMLTWRCAVADAIDEINGGAFMASGYGKLSWRTDANRRSE